MVKMLIDLDENTDKEVAIYKIKKNLKNKEEAINAILIEYFK